MNTLTGYSKNRLSDNYLLTAAGGHLAAGVENGSAAIYVSWPTYAKLKELNYIDANYGTGDYGYPDEEFLKGICKWAIANYSGSSCTLLGAIAPNSSGTCCMHLYGNSGFDATTKLPRYCMGWYQALGGLLRYFGTSDYVWTYSGYARVTDVKNPVNYYWANVPISDKSSTTTSPTVNTITANNYVTFGTYGARFTSDIRDSWRTSIYGDTTNQSRLRTVRTDVTIADFSEHYGSGLAWASGDTQGYLSVSHASGKAWIGGGNSDKLNWSTELITGKNIANQSVKQATAATKWATARAITLNGLLQGSVSLDGSLNVTLTSYNYHCIAGSSATNNYPYHLIMKCDPITNQWVDLFGLYRITQGYKGGNIGVFYVVVRTNSGTTASTCEIGWIYRKGFAVDAIQAGFYDVLGNTYIDVFCKTNSTYIKNTVEQISITKSRGEIGRGFTLQSSSESSTLLSDKSYITNTSKTTSYSTIASGLTNAAGGNALRTYTSIISATDSQAHIYLATIASKLGSSTVGGTYLPIYLSSGSPVACSTYAGGTAITLNGSSKSASTASFYAPTTAGTSGQVLTSTAGTPSWTNQSSLSVGSATNADKLDGYHLSSVLPISAYSYASGYLVQTDIATESNTMIAFRIEGNSYGYDSILTTGHFYNYKADNSILNASAIHHGYDFGNIIVFCYNNLVHLWFALQSNYQSFVVYVYGTNVNTKGVNRVTSITNSALPTSGVTRKVTITPAKGVANYDLAKAIKTITRSGTTFTYTCLDGTTGTFTQLDNNTTYSFSGGVDKFTVTPSSGSAIDVSVGTLLVNGTYTGGGGQQRPSYIGNGKVRWNMMRATTDYFDSSPFSGYCDWMMMDTYYGPDVPYVTMIGVLKSATPHAYIASGAKGDSSGKWTIKTLLDSDNYTTYTVKKDGTGASGTWGITASKATKDVDGNAFKTTYLRKVTVANNANNDFNTFENMTLTGRGDPKTGASLSNAPWTGSGPAGGYGVLTYLWSEYGIQMAFGYNSNKIYIRNKNYSSGSTAWSSTWDSLALTSDLKNPTDYYWANVNISSSSSTSTTPKFGLVQIISDTYPGLLVKRSNSTNSSIISFANSNGALGGIGTAGSANSGLRRYKHDYSESYLILDANNSSVSGGGSSWGSSITVNLGGATKILTIPSAPTSVSGNAGTATTLQTARTISLSTGVVATPTSFNGSANISIPVTEIKEGYLTWGGKNHAGAFGPVDAGLVPMLGANRLAFMPAEGVTVEVSTNGGSSWTTYPSITDEAKIALFNGNGTNLYIGGSNAKKIDKSNYKVRITIDTSLAKVYTELRKFIINVSTQGSTGSYCTITTRTLANYEAGANTWVTQAENVALSGWSGWNVINVAFTTYGNSSNHHRQIRLTFGCTSHSSTLDYTGLHIIKIIGIGGVGWTTPSTMALTGNIFSYDNYQGVEFPGNIYPQVNNAKTLGTSSRKWSNIYATTFTGNLTGNVTGNLTGNVTGNVTGSSGSCTGNAATATKLGTATKGSTSKPIYLNAGTPTECSTYAGGTAVTLNGSSKAGSTASFYAPTSVGANGLMLISSGSGAPTWLNINLGYIGRTAVLANAAALSLTGIGNITPETTKTYTLGTTSVRWKSAYINDINISQSGTETISRIFEDVGTTGGFYLNTSSAWGFTIQHKKSNTNYAITFATTTFAPAPITSETSTTYINLGSSSKPWGDIYGTYKGCLRSPAIIWCGYLNRAYSSTIWSAVKEGGLAILTFVVSDASINGYVGVAFTGYRVLGAFCSTRSLHNNVNEYHAAMDTIVGRSGGMGDYMTLCSGSDLIIRKFKQQNENNDLWNSADLATTSTENGNKPVTSFYLVVVGY